MKKYRPLTEPAVAILIALASGQRSAKQLHQVAIGKGLSKSLMGFNTFLGRMGNWPCGPKQWVGRGLVKRKAIPHGHTRWEYSLTKAGRQAAANSTLSGEPNNEFVAMMVKVYAEYLD